MKIVKKINAVLFMAFFAALVTSCSEFMLIPISIDYPFDKNDKVSPSTYSININDGFNEVEKIFSGRVSTVTDKLVKDLKDQGAEVFYPKFTTDDILKLISGENVVKTIGYNISTELGSESGQKELSFSICDFDTDGVDFSSKSMGIEFNIKNMGDFCRLSESGRQTEINRCRIDADENCLHLKVLHENAPIMVKMAEQKELKKYKKYLDKIYSATLNDISFTIKNPPNYVAGNDAFQLKAELYAQAINPFMACEEGTEGCQCESDGDTKKCYKPCKDGDNLLACSYEGVNDNGEIEDYFKEGKDEDGAETKSKYLVGVFETEDNQFSADQIMNLVYTYEGKDTVQKAIKHLDFQLGIKSTYILYPQALKPEGTLTASIKAKLLFNVEPLN